MKPSILTDVTPHYIVDKEGKKTGVILDIKTFTTMIEELEDLHDIILAEKLLAEGEKEEGRTIEEIEKALHEED